MLLFSRSVMSDSLQHHGWQHTGLPCPSPSPKVCSNSCPLSQWCHPTILSSVIPFFSCLQSFPASGSFLAWASLVAQLIKNLPGECRRPWFDSWVGKIPWRRARLPTPVFLASLVAQMVKNPPTMWEIWLQSLGWEDPLEEGMARRSIPGDNHFDKSLCLLLLIFL